MIYFLISLLLSLVLLDNSSSLLLMELLNFPKPQILLKLKDIENGIIIVEIDSFGAETYAILYNYNSFKLDIKIISGEKILC